MSHTNHEKSRNTSTCIDARLSAVERATLGKNESFLRDHGLRPRTHGE